MKAVRLHAPAPIETNPLVIEDIPAPAPSKNQIRIKVDYCGVCRTDLHIVEGELKPVKLPVIIGHQIVGRVDKIGAEVKKFKIGDLIGLPWLGKTCGNCSYCKKGLENLCDEIEFFGYSIDGGYAEYALADEDFAHHLPNEIYGASAAPLLCGGVIGYRAYKLSEIEPNGTLGLFGFGASAHLVLQIAIYHNCKVFVFTRGKHHIELAKRLGAFWAGTIDEGLNAELDSAIVFAPSGELVIEALKRLKRGGCVAHAGIYSSPIPSFDYELLYGERKIKSVANSTRADVHELLELAVKIPLKPTVEVFNLNEANEVLNLLKAGKLQASAVLKVT